MVKLFDDLPAYRIYGQNCVYLIPEKLDPHQIICISQRYIDRIALHPKSSTRQLNIIPHVLRAYELFE